MIDLSTFYAVLRCEFINPEISCLKIVPALTVADEIREIKQNNPDIYRCWLSAVISSKNPRTAELIYNCCQPYARNVQEALELLEESGLCAECEELFLSLFDSEGGIEEACDAYQYHKVRFWKGYELEELATELYQERNGVYYTEADDPTEIYDFIDNLRINENFYETEYGVVAVDR